MISIRKEKQLIEKLNIVITNYQTIQVKAFSFALITAMDSVYVAEAGNSFISKKQIKGKLIDHILHKDYTDIEKSIVEAKIDINDIPDISTIKEIKWPYSSSEITPNDVWETLILKYPEKLIANEESVINNIINYIAKSNIKFSIVVEYGSSHGELIRRLKLLYSGLDIIGIDPSKEMINFSRKNVPDVKFIQGDFFTELSNQPDLIVSRALGNGVLDKNLIPGLMEKIIQLVTPGGYIIFHSNSPSLVSSEILEKYGEVIKTIMINKDSISPFYVLKKNK
ncbi:MAG: class I SAM-dependent methyltransferase [Clostridiales bacterium]